MTHSSIMKSVASNVRTFGMLLMLACVFAGHASLALAERSDRDKPINFQGDKLGGNTGTKISDLIGNVVITQGTLTIHADRIQFHQNPDNSVSATAYGNPVSFREKRDDSDEYYEGYAQRVEYDGSKRFVELFDRALLKKSGDEIRSNYISYNAETNILKAEGRPDAGPATAGDTPLGSRVRGTFLPQNKDTTGAGDATKEGKDTKSAKPAESAKTSANSPLPLKSDSSLKTSPPK